MPPSGSDGHYQGRPSKLPKLEEASLPGSVAAALAAAATTTANSASGGGDGFPAAQGSEEAEPSAQPSGPSPAPDAGVAAGQNGIVVEV